MQKQPKQNSKKRGGIKLSKTPRRSHTAPSVRINVTISKSLLKMVDEAAMRDFTTRSDLIRMALLWYIRPQGRDLDHVDPDVILKTLQHRKARIAIKKMLKTKDT